MALYNMIVFQLLVFEMLLFIALIIPLPFTWRRAMFKFLAENPIVAKLQFALKILFIFVGVLFVDALQHMLKVYKEGADAKEKGSRTDLRSETDWRSRKFLSERNMYLTGFTLFLSLILSRTYSLILDLIKCQEELAALRKTGGAKTANGKTETDARLKALQAEYDALAEKYNTLDTAKAGQAPSNKKSD